MTGAWEFGRWTCGHVAGAACAECYRILAAKAAQLQEDVDTHRDAQGLFVGDDLERLARVIRALAAHAREMSARAHDPVEAVQWGLSAHRLDIAAAVLGRKKHGRRHAHEGQAGGGAV